MFDKLKNIFKKPQKVSNSKTILTPNIKTIIIKGDDKSSEFYLQRLIERGLDPVENLRITTEKDQAKMFEVSLEEYKKDQAKKLQERQEFYNQRKIERGLDNE